MLKNKKYVKPYVTDRLRYKMRTMESISKFGKTGFTLFCVFIYVTATYLTRTSEVEVQS